MCLLIFKVKPPAFPNQNVSVGRHMPVPNKIINEAWLDAVIENAIEAGTTAANRMLADYNIRTEGNIEPGGS